MKLHIPRDMFDNPTPPRLILCQTNREKIGELPAYDIQLNAKWNAYSELSFTINRMYNDIITGETKVHPLFDLAEGLRKVYVEGFGYFTIQDPDTDYSDNETKKLSCFSIEYETGQKYLENFFINTGEEDSVEVIYHASTLGNDYFNKDKMYTEVTDVSENNFDIDKKYYIKSFDQEKNGGYHYELTSISDSKEFAKHTGTEDYPTLYEQAWPNVQFYNESTPELSLLNLIFKKIPEWKIAHVDGNLRKQERKFDEDRVAVYDFLMNDICDTFKCVIEWDTINMEVSFYEEEEDGVTEDGEIQTRFDTDVFISRDNLANSINIKYSTDDIKTKLKVTGGDDLDIREVNLGQNYILNLDYYHTVEWMGQELYDKYGEYKQLLEKNEPKYKNLMKSWVNAYNKWNNLMNQVPSDNSVMLIGDKFTQLYCTYTDVDTLKNKLTQHGVNEDTEGINSDNVLLTLRKGEDSATIRVYYTGSRFEVKRELVQSQVDAPTTIKETEYYTLKEWVEGISASDMGLDGFTVHYIGTLGAYLCLSKDESKTDNLQNYGVNLLRERQEVYKTIFVTQTENLMSQVSKEDAACIAQDDEPTGKIPDGTRWLKTSEYPLKLYKYKANADKDEDPWKYISEAKDELAKYALYKENYQKLKAVQKVLKQKERKATYLANGYPRPEHYYYVDVIRGCSAEIIISLFNEDIKEHFDSVYGEGKYTLTGASSDLERDIPIYKFEITPKGSDSATPYAIYIKNGTPYISYRKSLGALQARMDRIKSIVNMENYFGEEDWERLSPFIKEDEFNDSNFILTGYESEENRINICKELKSAAEKELKTLSQPSLEFSMDMANILAIPEFDPIKDNFALGNFVTVGIRPDYVKKSRLLEVSLDFEDMSNLKATFGNLVTTKSEIDKHADLLKQAVTAGKSVAANATSWQRAVDKSNSIDKAIREGLKDAALEVGAAYGQSITWDQYGIWGRKLQENSTDTYEPEQFKLINNKLVFTDDDWNTSQAVFGKFQYDSNKDGVKEEHWGVLAQSVIGGYIEGSDIVGGTIDIGNGSFMVDETGKVTMGEGSRVGSMTVQEIQDYIADDSNVVYGTCPIHGNYLADEIWIVGNNDYIQTTDNGDMVNSNGQVIAPISMGIINDDETLVLDSEGNTIGKILDDDIVVDNNDNTIGVYDSGRQKAFSIVGYIKDGEAVDSSGTSIGTISGYIVMNDDTLVGLIIKNYVVSSEMTTETVDVNIVEPGSVLRSVNDGKGVYKSKDWITALEKYDKQHNSLSGRVGSVEENLNQHFEFSKDNGLVIKAVGDKTQAKIYTKLTNDRWSFIQQDADDPNDEDEVAYISDKKLHISSAEITGLGGADGNLDVNGSATVKELRVDDDDTNNSLVIKPESNGSFSILIETKES